MKNITVDILNLKIGQNSDFFCYSKIENHYFKAKKLNNFIYTSNGMLVKRPNTVYLDKIKEGTIDSCLNLGEIRSISIVIDQINFIFIFTENKMKIFKNLKYLMEIDTAFNLEIIKNMDFVFDKKDCLIYFFAVQIKPISLKINVMKNEFIFLEVSLLDGPYFDINKDSNRFLNLFSSDNKTFLSSNIDMFDIYDIGRKIRLAYDNKWGIVEIIGFINPKEVYCKIIKNLNGIGETKLFRMDVFNDKYGYPSLGVICNNRLYLAKNNYDKSSVYASCFNDLLNFAPTIMDEEFQNSEEFIGVENAIYIKYSDIGEILKLKTNGKYVYVFEFESLFLIKERDPSSVLSPYNYYVYKIADNYGNGESEFILDNLLYVGMDKKNIYMLIKTFNDNYYTSIKWDEFLMENLTTKITKIVVIESPFYMILLLKEDGSFNLVSFFDINNLAKNKYNLMFSNSKHSFFYGKLEFKDVVYDVFTAKILDNLYLIFLIKRFVKNKWVVMLEYFNIHSILNLNDKKIYLDSFRKIISLETEKYLIEDLIGLEVDICVNFEYLGKKLLTESLIKECISKGDLYIGFNNESCFESVDFEDIYDIKTLTMKKAMNFIYLYLVNSFGGTIKNGINNKILIDNIANINNNGDFFTGEKNIKLEAIFNNKQNLIISQNLPFNYCITMAIVDFSIME